MFRGETPKKLCVAKKPTHESPNDYCRCASCLHHFVDTRLWKTKHSRKRLQNFRQSWVLSKDRIEIHQSQPLLWPSDLLYVMLAGCDWWISIRSVDNTQGCRKFWKRFRGCSRINENGGWIFFPLRERTYVFLYNNIHHTKFHVLQDSLFFSP